MVFRLLPRGFLVRVLRFTVSVSPATLSMWRDFREVHILSKNFPDVSIAMTSGGNLLHRKYHIKKLNLPIENLEKVLRYIVAMQILENQCGLIKSPGQYTSQTCINFHFYKHVRYLWQYN